jgi:hypothetical protein
MVSTMARIRSARMSKASVADRIVPESAVGFDTYRALLVFVLLPGLIFYMSRKVVDSVHVTTSAGHAIAESWPTSALPFAHPAAARRAFPLSAAPDLDPVAANSVYSRAMLLERRYDSRPYWHFPQLAAGVPATRYTADLAIEHLIPCESGGATINRIDTNGKMSYGILQFQDWDEWERMSGISGNPDNRADAIRMAEWAIQNGYINRWTCANILKITT